MEFPTVNPIKEKLYRQIKSWLLRFGERDNDGFYYSTDDWDFYLSFDYDLDGARNVPHFSIRSTKGRNIDVDYLDRTEEELQSMITELLSIKNTN